HGSTIAHVIDGNPATVLGIFPQVAQPPHVYTLPLHDALPISPTSRPGTWAGPSRCSRPPSPTGAGCWARTTPTPWPPATTSPARSEEHTCELQSRENLVCRLLREKKTMARCWPAVSGPSAIHT